MGRGSGISKKEKGHPRQLRAKEAPLPPSVVRAHTTRTSHDCQDENIFGQSHYKRVLRNNKPNSTYAEQVKHVMTSDVPQVALGLAITPLTEHCGVHIQEGFRPCSEWILNKTDEIFLLSRGVKQSLFAITQSRAGLD